METRRYGIATLAGVAAICAALTVPRAASAEIDTVRMSQQFGMNYLQIHVMLEKGLIEKHAKALGIAAPKLSLHRFSGGGAMIDALLSNSIDFATGGISPMLQLWDKTNGQVKGVGPIADMDMRLNTIDPDVKSLKDFLGDYKYKIAVPSVKVSGQAVALQMAAEKLFGDPEKLDHLTVSMPQPTAYTAIMGGGTEVRSHIGNMPFEWLEEQSGKVRTIMSYYDIMGGPANGSSMWASKSFKDANPKTFQAVARALQESVDIINADLKAAAELYVRFEKSKFSVDDVHAMLKSGYIGYTKIPRGTQVVADFMHKRGSLKKRPPSWKDVYWEVVHGFDGS